MTRRQEGLRKKWGKGSTLLLQNYFPATFQPLAAYVRASEMGPLHFLLFALMHAKNCSVDNAQESTFEVGDDSCAAPCL